MRDAIESNMDPQPVADDLSDGYIADRMYWDAQSTVPMVPGTPTVLDSQTQQQDFGPTPEASPTMVQSSDNSVVLGPSETISIVAATLDADARTTRDPTDDTGPCIPLENSEIEPQNVVFPPLPPQLPIRTEDIRPEDALDRSVPSLDDLREGKLDTMEDRSETLGNCWET